LTRVASLGMSSEVDLVRRAQAGDAAAWSALVQSHHAALYRLAWAILRHEEDARDMCQDAYHRAFLCLSEFSSENRLDAWLKRIVVNRCRDWLRKKAVRAAAAEELTRMPEGDPAPQTIVSGRESRDKILRALDRLPLEFREVLVPHLLEDLSYADLAELLEVSVNAVRIRVHRGLLRLRELVGEEGR